MAAANDSPAAHGAAGIWYNADVIMRVYLDNCCYNRPFDPQTDLRVCLETMAKMRVQALMKDGEAEDYTTWHRRPFDNGESARALGEKVKALAAAKRQRAVR